MKVTTHLQTLDKRISDLKIQIEERKSRRGDGVCQDRFLMRQIADDLKVLRSLQRRRKELTA